MEPRKIIYGILNGNKWMRRNPSRCLNRLRFSFIGELHLQRVRDGEVVGRLWKRRQDTAILRSQEEETHPGLRRPIMPSLQQAESDLVPVTYISSSVGRSM